MDASASTPMPRALWIDQTDQVLDSTAQWTNKVELADLDGDGRPKEAIMKRYHCRARHESRVLKLETLPRGAGRSE